MGVFDTHNTGKKVVYVNQCLSPIILETHCQFNKPNALYGINCKTKQTPKNCTGLALMLPFINPEDITGLEWWERGQLNSQKQRRKRLPEAEGSCEGQAEAGEGQKLAAVKMTGSEELV